MERSQLPPLHLMILAGGQSTRARRGDSAAPKQFQQVGGNMLLMWSVRELLSGVDSGQLRIATLTIAAPRAWHAVVGRELEGAQPVCPWYLAPAGDTRTASTWEAIQTLAAAHPPRDSDLVAVHDAARPFATHHLLLRLAEAAQSHGAAVPGVPVTDTVVTLEEGQQQLAEARYLERRSLRALQTPQVFGWGPFLAAHSWCHQQDRTFTDDGGLLAARGLTPVVVMGEPDNWKITTESDLARIAAVIKGSDSLRRR